MPYSSGAGLTTGNIPTVTEIWAGKHVWKLYDTQTDTRAPPTQNTYHEIFALEDGCMLQYITVEQNNDETGDKNVDIKLTIDGESYEKTGNALANGEIFYVYWTDIGTDPPAATLVMSIANPLTQFGFRAGESAAGAWMVFNPNPMTDCKLELKMTSAPGTNQTMVTKYRKLLHEAIA